MDLNGKIALVTGAGSGIGRAAAVRLAELGAEVAVVGHSHDSGQDAAAEICRTGGVAVPFAAELGEADTIDALFAKVSGRWDYLDILVANAGVNGVWAPLEELHVQEWTRTLTVNLTGTFLTVKNAIPLLRAAGGGSVVRTSGPSASTPGVPVQR